MKPRWVIFHPDGMPVWDEKTDKPRYFNSFAKAKDFASTEAPEDAGGYYLIYESVAYAVMEMTPTQIRPIGLRNHAQGKNRNRKAAS